MGLLDSLFGGGGGSVGSTEALYGGLLTPEQLQALKSEQATKGLLAMAAAFGQAGMPSRLPVPTGAVLGQVAGALGQTDDTSAIGKFLAAQKLAAETQTLKAKQEWIKRANDPNDPLAQLIERYYGGIGTPGGTVPPPAGTPVDADGNPLVSAPSPATGAPSATTGAPRGGINPVAPFGKPGNPIPLVPGNPATAPAVRGGMPGETPEGEDSDTQGGIVRPLNPALAAPSGQGAAVVPAVPFPTRVSGPAVPAPTWAGTPDSMIAALAQSRRTPAGGMMPPPNPGSFFPPAGLEPYTSPTQMAGFRTPQQFRQDLPLVDPDVGEQVAAVRAPDVVIPSGARPAIPVIRTQAQLPPNLANPTPLRAPPATAGAPPAMAGPQIPATPRANVQAPPPPPGDLAGQAAIMRELARRNATAEMLGLGNPYGSLLSVLQNSPQAEALKEWQRRNIGLGFAGPEAAAQAAAKFPFEMTAAQYQSALKRYENQVQSLGNAALEPAPDGIRVATGRIGPDGKPETTVLQGTRLQAAQAANGFAVPELGIPGIDINTGQNTRAAPGFANPPYGTPAGKPAEPSEIEKAAGKGSVEDARAEIKQTHAEAVAANRRAPLYATLTAAMDNFQTGRTAEYRLLIGQVYQDVTGRKVEGVPEGEVMQSIFARLQTAMVPKGQGSASDFERRLFGQIPGSIINSPEALHQLIGIGLQLDAYDQKVAEVWRNSIDPRTGIPDYRKGLEGVTRLGPALNANQLNALERYSTIAAPGTGAAPAPGQPGAPRTRVIQTERGPVTVTE